MRVAHVLAVAALAVLSACGGDGDDDDGVGPGTPVFTTLDVQPATVTVAPNGGTQPLTATARDQNNGTMSGLTVTYTSSDNSKATVNNAGVVTGVAVGTATITATGTVGTVQKTKTVSVTVSAPVAAANVAATANNAFEPPAVIITSGGTVTWTFAIQHNVTFGGPAPTGGSIPNTSSGSVTRTFPTAGKYDYTCTLHANMSGTVTVQ